MTSNTYHARYKSAVAAILIFAVFVQVFLPWLSLPQAAHASITNGANAVDMLGQTDNSLSAPGPAYTKSTINNAPNRMGYSFTRPFVLVDPVDHRFFVSDDDNNRVLVYDLTSTNELEDYEPDYVLGQPDFYSNATANTQSGMNDPRGLAYATSSKLLFVAEGAANRVKVFDLSGGITNGMDASYVLGQSTFTGTASADTASGLDGPSGLAYDPGNQHLYVSQIGSFRISVFDFSGGITNGMDATNMLGHYDDITAASPQPVYTKTLTGDAPNRLGFELTSDSHTALDPDNHRFFVVDSTNIRVLVYNLNTDNTFPDRIPDYVLGQSNYYSRDANSAASGFLANPRGVEYATSTQQLFVSNGNRISVFNLSGGITNGMSADYVLGQANFTNTGAANSQAGTNIPHGMVYDNARNWLFVVERSNKVKVYDLSGGITNGMNASYVLGQADFTTGTAAVTQAGMSTPVDVAYDPSRQYLFVSNSNRVTVYDVAAITNGENAINVIGQSTFTGSTAAATQAGIGTPQQIDYDAATQRLFVTNNAYARVTIYDMSTITDGENAINVIGQTTFTGSSGANTQSGLNSVRGATYDSLSKRLFVLQSGAHRVTVFDAATSTITNGANAVDGLGQYDDNLSDPQPVYTRSTSANNPNKMGFNFTYGYIELDLVGHRLFFSDDDNNRVLVWNLSATNELENYVPDYVLGQGDYYTITISNTQTGTTDPRGMAYATSTQKLYVATSGNNSVRVFDLSGGISTNMSAANVLGQSNFTNTGSNLTQAGLSQGSGISYDWSTKMLYVAQVSSRRISVFDVDSISDNENAVNLLGQYDDETAASPQPIYTKSLVNNAPNRLGLDLSAQSLTAVDTLNHRLFVMDGDNSRVLVYNLNSDHTFPDRIPDYVLGQANYYSNTAANTQSGLNAATALVYSTSTSMLFVAERSGNRVKVFDLSGGITNGMNASYVLGQANFTGATAANTQSGLNAPYGLAYDEARDWLFVSEGTGNRVKVFDLSGGISNNMNASYVLGQANFTASTAAVTQAGMSAPRGVAYEQDRQYLYVSQETANRVTVYDTAAITDGENAINVIGQSTFTGTTAANTQAGMNAPTDVAYDPTTDRLFVAQATARRVTVFDMSTISDGESATHVLGQSLFTTATAATTQAGMNSPRGATFDSVSNRLYVSDSGLNRVSVYDVSAPGSISGTLYASDGTTPLTNKTIAVSINGAAAATTAETDASTGAFTLSSVSMASGDILTLYVDGETEKGVTVTVATGSALTNIDIWQNHLNVRCETSCPLTNANLTTADTNADADIASIYAASGTTLTMASGSTLRVPSGHSFTPGGTVTAVSVRVAGTLTQTGETTVSGSWDASGGTFSVATTTFTGTASDLTVTSDGDDFATTTFNGSGGTWTLQDALVVTGNLTITAGTLDTKSGSNYPLTVTGNWSNSGAFTARQATTTFSGGNQTLLGSTSFYHLAKESSTGATLTFTAGTTQTITGNLFLAGISGTPLLLRSSAASSTWTIDPQGARILSYLDVQDSTNSNATKIDASSSATAVSSGGNTGWNFNKASSTAPASISETDGDVVFSVTVTDADSDETKLKVEYSEDGGTTWQDPKITAVTASAGSVGLSNADTYQVGTSDAIDTDSGSVTLTITWDTESTDNGGGALSGSQSDVMLRVTPNDFSADGIIATSSAFTVDNTAATPAPSSSSSYSQPSPGSWGVISPFYFPPTPPSESVAQVSPALPVEPTSPIIENIVDSIVDFFTPESEVDEVPVKADTPEAPLSLSSPLSLLGAKKVQAFVFAPLPGDVRAIASKFPQIGSTFSKLGITRIGDFSRLVGSNFSLPNLSEVPGIPTSPIANSGNFNQSNVPKPDLGSPEFSDEQLTKLPNDRGLGAPLLAGDKLPTVDHLGRPVKPGEAIAAVSIGVPISSFSKTEKATIPTEFVFARSSDEKIDLGIKLSINEKGDLRQTVNTLAGQEIKLVVKPEHRAERVEGYIILYPEKIFGIEKSIPLSSMVASIIMANPKVAKEQTKAVERRLVLDTFEYTDRDNDGIYEAIVSMPLVEGQYQIKTVIEYEDRRYAPKEIELITVIDPEGYIYESVGKQELRISDAIVSIYWRNPATKEYELWPADEYQQENPQITDKTGRYSFLVTVGSYYITVDADGYDRYVGEPFLVTFGDGIHENIALKKKGIFKRLWNFLRNAP